ncbi:HTH domain-containing protein, partial [Methanocorpusculum sp.]|nr:HTH domain-containing protein [Methanocorpusculum sp.]
MLTSPLLGLHTCLISASLHSASPYTLNVSDLASRLSVSRDSVYKLLDLLQKAG